MPSRVLTETSVYLIDTAARTATRLPRHREDDVERQREPRSELRCDGEAVPLLAISPITVGQPMTLVLGLREDGVPTLRTTTPVCQVLDE